MTVNRYAGPCLTCGATVPARGARYRFPINGSGGKTDVALTADDRWMVLVDGYQWGTDAAQWDSAVGCSTQTYPTKRDALAAYLHTAKG